MIDGIGNSTHISIAAPSSKPKAASPAPAPTSGKAAGGVAPVIEEELYKSPLSVEEKVAIAMSVGEEVLTVEELTALYTARDHPIVYDGFEPSGRMHIAQVQMPTKCTSTSIDKST